jgi:xylulokinase
MATDVVVAGGAGDCAASAIGLGAIAPGDAFLSLERRASCFASPTVLRRARVGARLLPRFAGLWHQMGVMLSAAGPPSPGSPASWQRLPPRCWRHLVKPWMRRARSGSSPISMASARRTTTLPPAARSLACGCDRARSNGAAVLEGVAFAARDNLAALGGASSAITEVDLVGGGSRSALWAQICADVLGIPVHRVEEGEVGRRSARPARPACRHRRRPAQVCTRPRRLRAFTPRASRQPPMTTPITSGESCIPR